MRVLSVVALASIGIGASFAFLPAMGLMILMPALAFAQPSRRVAFLAAFTYYACASWAIIPAIRNFFGPNAGPASGAGLWLLSSALLALPWPLLWCAGRRGALWRIPLAITLGVVPPLGIIGWASPLLSAGLLFPGAGWTGLTAIMLVPAFLVMSPRLTGTAVLSCALAANVASPKAPEPPSRWEAVDVDTDLGGVGQGSHAILGEFRTAQRLQMRALAAEGTVVIFPEAAIPMWTEASEAFWQKTLADLRVSGKTVFLGACAPIPGRPGYQNLALIRGADTGTVSQRIPVPIGMWKPLSDGGVPLRPFASGVALVHGQRIAVLICYEQLLSWPILVSAIGQPNMIVGMANDRWTRFTTISRCQSAALNTWSRLFRIPRLASVNR